MMNIDDAIPQSVRGSLRFLVAWLMSVFFTIPCLAAVPTAVNKPITDEVTQARIQLLGNSPALALGDMYLAVAQAIANANGSPLLPQQSMVVAQNSTTAGLSSISNIGASTSALATKTIPGGAGLRPLAALPPGLAAEGMLGGASLLMFELEGSNSPFADYYVVSDQGFDYYTDQDENLVMFAHQVRTFGTATSPATDVGFLIPANSVAQYLPQLLESPLSDGEVPISVAAEPADAVLRDIYIGLKYADGTTAFYEGNLQFPYGVPEPSSFVLAFVALIAAHRLRR